MVTFIIRVHKKKHLKIGIDNFIRSFKLISKLLNSSVSRIALINLFLIVERRISTLALFDNNVTKKTKKIMFEAIIVIMKRVKLPNRSDMLLIK